jgi:hypothetical protein
MSKLSRRVDKLQAQLIEHSSKRPSEAAMQYYTGDTTDPGGGHFGLIKKSELMEYLHEVDNLRLQVIKLTNHKILNSPQEWTVETWKNGTGVKAITRFKAYHSPTQKIGCGDTEDAAKEDALGIKPKIGGEVFGSNVDSGVFKNTYLANTLLDVDQ